MTKLNVPERLVLLMELPKEGDFLTLKLIRELRENISFKEAELKEFELKTKDDGCVSWNIEKGKLEVEISIIEFGEGLIKKTLKKLDENKKLEDKHFTLYEKFVENKVSGIQDEKTKENKEVPEPKV